jgi:hypothetical protein
MFFLVVTSAKVNVMPYVILVYIAYVVYLPDGFMAQDARKRDHILQKRRKICKTITAQY